MEAFEGSRAMFTNQVAYIGVDPTAGFAFYRALEKLGCDAPPAKHPLRIPDPMMFFEEITRHRLLQGILPDVLYSTAAAFSAWLADRQPERTLLVGAAVEGQIVLPVNELKRKYS
jgi:hypothetical protein